MESPEQSGAGHKFRPGRLIFRPAGIIASDAPILRPREIMPKYYQACAIDYPNGEPHLGHAFEKIGADCQARFQRLLGNDVFFSTGVDENSLNVARTALARGQATRDFVDSMSPKFARLWEHLEISASAFIRTTEDRHTAASQEFFRRAQAKGDIYLDRYEGWYCLSCENYYAEAELAEGLCPIHLAAPEWLAEENYFFRLSGYRDRLRQHFLDNPEFVIPRSRYNEMFSLIESGLKDFSVSRHRADWGIPTPDDSEHVIYVWFDALINYATVVGFGGDPDSFSRWWPCDAQVIGKDILRFHAIYWPAMLWSCGLEPPIKIVSHGFIDMAGEKLSKTRGNVVDPYAITKHYGVDPLRYYLLREMRFLLDGSFRRETLDSRYHHDLGNDLGNLLNRCVKMIARYRDGTLPAPSQHDAIDDELREAAKMAWHSTTERFGAWEFSEGLEAIWRLIAAGNRYVDKAQPFRIAADPAAGGRVDTILYLLADCLRQIAVLITPVMPAVGKAMALQLGCRAPSNGQWASAAQWSLLTPGQAVPGGSPLFPRLEMLQ